MTKSLYLGTILLGGSLLLSGCGSSDSTSNSSSVNTGTAFYVDSAVKGVTVSCGTTVSVTNNDGAFSFESGQNCQFKVGDIILRNESNIYEGQIIIEDNIKTAQFLQMLDHDGNVQNGITISVQSPEVLAQAGVTNVPQNDNELANLSEILSNSGIGYQGHYVSAQEAWEHLNDTYNQYDLPLPTQPEIQFGS